MIDEYNIKFITDRLHTARVGRWLRMYQEVSSSNELAQRLAERGEAPDGGAVITEYQSAGRGRLGRTWAAPSRSSILASFILRPADLPANRSFALTICLATAVRAAILRLFPELNVQLKWPNDIMVDEQKVGGILSVVGFSGDKVNWAVLGLGLNVNISRSDLIGLSSTAISLSLALGHKVDRTILFATICDELEPRYDALLAGEFDPLRREWAGALCWQGREVRVSNAGGESVIEGRMAGVASDGALLIQPAQGEPQRVMAGDLSLRLR